MVLVSRFRGHSQQHNPWLIHSPYVQFHNYPGSSLYLPNLPAFPGCAPVDGLSGIPGPPAKFRRHLDTLGKSECSQRAAPDAVVRRHSNFPGAALFAADPGHPRQLCEWHVDDAGADAQFAHFLFLASVARRAGVRLRRRVWHGQESRGDLRSAEQCLDAGVESARHGD